MSNKYKYEDLHQRFIAFRQELLDDPTIPQDMKDVIRRGDELLAKKAEEEKRLREDEDMVVVSYNVLTFEPKYISKSLLEKMCKNYE